MENKGPELGLVLMSNDQLQQLKKQGQQRDMTTSEYLQYLMDKDKEE